jgi:hypothetical protein
VLLNWLDLSSRIDTVAHAFVIPADRQMGRIKVPDEPGQKVRKPPSEQMIWVRWDASVTPAMWEV